jgi:hypothetical protein
MLLKAGADVTACNSDGMLPVDVAGDERTRALLLKFVANRPASYPPLPSNVNKTATAAGAAGADTDNTSAKRGSLKMLSKSMKVCVCV